MLERPKILPRIQEIRATLADDLRLSLEKLTVKAKTGEGVDAVGEGRAVSALAIALVQRHIA
jgi:2-C-methyl-D-erythritol 2,4-cyclodiphosphate synthase